MKSILLAALAITFPSTVAFAQVPEHPFAKVVAAKLTNPKKNFTLIVKATVKEGEAEKFIAAFAEAIEPTRKEDGCSRYELNQINGPKTATDLETDSRKGAEAVAKEAEEAAARARAEFKKTSEEIQKEGKKESSDGK